MPDSSGGIPSNLTGATPSGYTPAYGAAPLIPDPIASMWQAIGGDAAAMPSLTSLADVYNLFNYNQQKSQVAGTPGFSNVNDLLNAKLPQDVQNRIAQSAAERGISTGTYGSPNADASLLSAMGLTSLDAQKLGQEEYGALLGHFPKAAPFDMSSLFVSPEQQQAANAAANVSAAAPNPKAAADEEMRKLLEAIAAGKAGVGGVGGVPGIPNLGGLIPGANGTGPAGAGGGQISPMGPTTSYMPIPGFDSFFDNPTAPVSQATNPPGAGWNLGTTSPSATNFIRDTVFGSPGFNNSGILGMGLNPQLNAMFNDSPSPEAGFAGAQSPFDVSSGWNLGSAPASGSPDASFSQGLFGPTSYQDSSMLGFGLDPTLNALLGPGGQGSTDTTRWWEDPEALTALFGEGGLGGFSDISDPYELGAGDYGPSGSDSAFADYYGDY